MRLILLRLAPAALVSLALWASAAVPTFAREPVTPAQAETTARSARRVADWQLAHMDGFDYVATFRNQAADPRDWIQAAFYIGLADFADVTGDSGYAEAVETTGRREGWGFGPRPRHADADAIGQVWIWAAGRVDGPERAARLAPIRARFDAILTAPSDVPLVFDDGRGERPCQARWCWSDALFMSPPAWAQLTRLTGDARYFDHADAEFQATVEALYDRDEHLFYRDSRFLARTGPNGHKVFWSRGNGWTYAGVVRILQALPPDHPRRPAYVALYRQMSARLIQLQGAAGYWPVSLLDPGGPPETSGTGFFVFGLAWGLNAGLLDPAVYGPLARRGWDALERAVQPDGRLGWVQQVGFAPDQVSAEDTQLYGSGAYLLAAGQMIRCENW